MQDAFAEMTGARTVPRVTCLATWLVEVILMSPLETQITIPSGQFIMANWKDLPGVIHCVMCMIYVFFLLNMTKFPSGSCLPAIPWYSHTHPGW